MWGNIARLAFQAGRALEGMKGYSYSTRCHWRTGYLARGKASPHKGLGHLTFRPYAPRIVMSTETVAEGCGQQSVCLRLRDHVQNKAGLSPWHERNRTSSTCQG